MRGFLGEGAKKRVYLAHDTRLNRKVAVALIKDEILDDGGRERVQREAEAMGQLGDHSDVLVFGIVDDFLDQFFVFLIVGEPADQTAVDFHIVDFQAIEQTQGIGAGTKMVQTNLAANLPKVADQLSCECDMGRGQRLCDLENDDFTLAVALLECVLDPV